MNTRNKSTRNKHTGESPEVHCGKTYCVCGDLFQIFKKYYANTRHKNFAVRTTGVH